MISRFINTADTTKRDRLQAKMGRLQQLLNAEVEKLQKECKHEDVIEVPYKSSIPPHRVCAICGMQERGWYRENLKPTRELDFETAMRVRNELRRFVTVGNRFDDNR